MNILVSGRLPEKVMLRLSKGNAVQDHGEDRPMTRRELLDSVGDKDGFLCMITDKIDEELLNSGPRLKMIANLAVGFDNIDIEAVTARGIPVSNTPGVLTNATADLTFALILATARRLVEGDKRTRAGDFRFWAPLLFLGRDVSEKTLGIIGLGRIGRAVVRRARGFDMNILYHNRRRIKSHEENELGIKYVDLKTLIEQSDFISLHVPLTDETHHIIGNKELEMMKPEAYLINTSRGPVVDEKALFRALRKETIAGAGLDVYENEPSVTAGLKEMDNVILLPHVGSATIETRTKMGLKAAENLLAGLRGERPPDCLNWENLNR